MKLRGMVARMLEREKQICGGLSSLLREKCLHKNLPVVEMCLRCPKHSKNSFVHAFAGARLQLETRNSHFLITRSCLTSTPEVHLR